MKHAKRWSLVILAIVTATYAVDAYAMDPQCNWADVLCRLGF